MKNAVVGVAILFVFSASKANAQPAPPDADPVPPPVAAPHPVTAPPVAAPHPPPTVAPYSVPAPTAEPQIDPCTPCVPPRWRASPAVYSSGCQPCGERAPQVVLRRPTAFASKDARHSFLVAHDPAYRDAYAWRRGGTALAIAGGSVGLVLTFVGLVATAAEGIGNSWGGYDGAEGSGGRMLLVGGLVTTVVSVAVGLPMALSAHGRMKSIRSRYPIVGIGWGHHSGAVQLGWRF